MVHLIASQIFSLHGFIFFPTYPWYPIFSKSIFKFCFSVSMATTLPLLTSSHWTSLISASFAFHKTPKAWFLDGFFTPWLRPSSFVSNYPPSMFSRLAIHTIHLTSCGWKTLYGLCSDLPQVLLLFDCLSANSCPCSPVPTCPHHYPFMSVSLVLVERTFVTEPCHYMHIWTTF